MRYRRDELLRAVRIERMELSVEMTAITKRIRQIEDRMKELDKADGLLEGYES